MNYFQLVGLLFGSFTLLLALGWFLWMSRSRHISEIVLPENKPFWLTVLSWVLVFFMVLTWLLLIQNPGFHAGLITVIMTFNLFKFIGIFLNYDWFRKMYFDIMNEDIRAFYAVVFTTSLLSGMLIYLCLQDF